MESYTISGQRQDLGKTDYRHQPCHIERVFHKPQTGWILAEKMSTAQQTAQEMEKSKLPIGKLRAWSGKRHVQERLGRTGLRIRCGTETSPCKREARMGSSQSMVRFHTRTA